MVNEFAFVMKVLIACEFSGIVRDAFIKCSHDAMSCDFLPTEKFGSHYQGNVLEILNQGWDLMIAHPPCTRLCNSGVRWLAERNLWADMKIAARFFKLLLDAPIPLIAVENPIPHKYAVEEIGRTYNQIIHPWQFGHGEMKATCLWLKNLPKLRPTNIVRGREQRIFNMPKNADRGRLRSISFQGIADAMAKQWGSCVIRNFGRNEMEQRTAQEFVEDLLTDGRTAFEILAVAKNTYWKTRVGEVEQVIKSFSGKVGKKFSNFSKKKR